MEQEKTLTVGFTAKERELLALLVGSIAGGSYQKSLHIRASDLDGKESEIRDFLIKFYPVLKAGPEV